MQSRSRAESAILILGSAIGFVICTLILYTPWNLNPASIFYRWLTLAAAYFYLASMLIISTTTNWCDWFVNSYSIYSGDETGKHIRLKPWRPLWPCGFDSHPEYYSLYNQETYLNNTMIIIFISIAILIIMMFDDTNSNPPALWGWPGSGAYPGIPGQNRAKPGKIGGYQGFR